MDSVDDKVTALAEAFVRCERYGSTDQNPQRLYDQLCSLAGGSRIAAEAVIAQARAYYRQTVKLACGHVQTYKVTLRQLTGQEDRSWSRELSYQPSYYRAGVKVYCTTCPGRPQRMCTETTVDEFPIMWTVLMLNCGHEVTREHAADYSPRGHCGPHRCPQCHDLYRSVLAVKPAAQLAAGAAN